MTSCRSSSPSPPAGQDALDDVAASLVEEMASDSPEDIAQLLERVLRAPVAELAGAFEAAAERRHHACRRAHRPALVDVAWSSGWRRQMAGSWPFYPHEAHRHHAVAHPTLDGRWVLACCRLDASSGLPPQHQADTRTTVRRPCRRG
jgi:hypothetical protein